MLSAIAAAPAGAQSPWLALERRGAVRLEVGAGGLGDNPGGGDSFTAAFFAGARVPLGERTWIVGELPFVRGPEPLAPHLTAQPGGTFAWTAQGRSVVGNPYLGIERAAGPSGVHLEVGLRGSVANAHDADWRDGGRRPVHRRPARRRRWSNSRSCSRPCTRRCDPHWPRDFRSRATIASRTTARRASS